MAGVDIHVKLVKDNVNERIVGKRTHDNFDGFIVSNTSSNNEGGDSDQTRSLAKSGTETPCVPLVVVADRNISRSYWDTEVSKRKRII